MPNKVPLFRFYDESINKHFYTIQPDELNHTDNHYKNDGVIGFVYDDAGNDGIPIYRLYNPVTRAHFFTPLLEEVEASIKGGYQKEAVQFWAFKPDTQGTVPLHRFVFDSDEFFYTCNKEEGLKAKHFKEYQGYNFWIYPVPVEVPEIYGHCRYAIRGGSQGTAWVTSRMTEKQCSQVGGTFSS